MKFQFIINLLPYELNSIPSFFRVYGSSLRDDGYFWPNKYLIGSKNERNHNWLLSTENLNDGTTDEFINRCVEMNAIGKNTIIFIDWSCINMKESVFLEKIAILVSKIKFDYELSTLFFNFSTREFLKKSGYDLFNYDSNSFDTSSLKTITIKDIRNVYLSESESIKLLATDLVNLENEDNFYNALKEDHDLAVVLSDERFRDLLSYLISNSQYFSYDFNFMSIKNLIYKNIFLDYIKFLKDNNSEYIDRENITVRNKKEIIKDFFIFWTFFNSIG